MDQHPIGRIIKCPECVAQGAAWLAAHDPRFARAINELGTLPLRLKPDGFAQLLSAIVSQQISVTAAASIWKRLQDADLTSPQNISQSTDDDIRACGMSTQKIRYARALAAADIDFIALRTQPNADVFKTLTNVTGIGIWTAEIYAMFSLGRADVFAPGDLALQESARMLFNLNERPTERTLRKMALNWSPWQSVAARLLFAYYHLQKQREGIR
jgi:DNA-3-methyladenine glycosylase II